MTVPALRAVGVTKRYGDVAALEDVTLTVHPGEVYALLGLNGAGKTTLMRVLLGMVAPTAGTVEVLGHRLTGGSGRSRGAAAAWARTGYLVESASAYPELTTRENLAVIARLRGLRAPADERAVDDAVERLGLEPWEHRRARHLSLGNLQRLALAKALLHAPDVLLLDEPVNGLDPAGVVEVRTLLARLARDEGTAVLVSSHLIAEVSRIATRVGVLHHGRLRGELDASELDASARPRLEVAADDLGRARAALTGAGVDAAVVPGDLEASFLHLVGTGDER